MFSMRARVCRKSSRVDRCCIYRSRDNRSNSRLESGFLCRRCGIRQGRFSDSRRRMNVIRPSFDGSTCSCRNGCPANTAGIFRYCLYRGQSSGRRKNPQSRLSRRCKLHSRMDWRQHNDRRRLQFFRRDSCIFRLWNTVRRTCKRNCLNMRSIL